MIGQQTPRIKIEPVRAETDGEGAALLMQAYGYTLDEWQQLVVNCWLGKDQTGKYNVTSAGLSVPRQNGKNVCIEAREFYGLVVNGERILHTAHQVRTAKKAFRRLVAMFTDKKHPEIIRAVKKIRYGLGEECVELNNGGMIEFIARSRQAARGFDGLSLIVYDEAQELTEDQAEAIMATLSASSTGIRQQIYTGTPPYIASGGEVFKRFRQSCIEAAGMDEIGAFCWHEWSIAAEGIADLDINDKKLWYMSNPALGYRLTEEFTAEEAKTLSPEGFARERLGVWFKPVESVAEYAIAPELWEACSSDQERPQGKTAYGVKFSPDGSEVVLCGAVVPEEGPARITLIERQPLGIGLKWLADWLNARYKVASCVVIDGKGATDVLIDKISDVWRLKGTVIKPTAAQVVAAQEMLTNDLREKVLTWYTGQEALKDSALSATKRPIGSAGHGFGGADCAPIEACSLALWGCRTSKRNPQKVMRIG